jgi:hypothetical protein
MEWKSVNGNKGLHEISDSGIVRSLRYGRVKILKAKTDKDGYRVINLCYNGIVTTRKIHRLVGESFIENPDNKPFINHKDGNKANNVLNNLEWATVLENVGHAINVLGTWHKPLRGSDNKLSKSVRCDTLDMSFGSIREAERILGISMCSIRGACMGRYKQTNGFVFRYN